MRIVMVAGSLSRRAGGLFWSVRRLSQALAKAGADVHVLGLRDSDTAEDLAEWAPLEPLVLDGVGPAALGYAPTLGREIIRLAPDVVHLHGIWLALSQTTARWAAKGKPLIISPRGMLDPWAIRNSKLKKQLAWHLYERANLHHAAFIHALNSSEADAVRAVLPHANVATIPNGVDLPDPLPRRSLPTDGRPRLLFVGRIHPKKGLMKLLDQWSAVRPRLSRPWVLRIAGPDEVGHLMALRARAAALGLNDSVTFIGPLYGDSKVRELAEAEAFVLPSQSEGLPMAVLEAWAAGLPVLMTRACNLPEGFKAGAAHEIGDDPAALVEGLTRADLTEMGARGRALVAARFDWESIASRHMAIYAAMVQSSPNPPGRPHA